ncbi:hypothetical protein OROMI_007553 [Orobanche minor]
MDSQLKECVDEEKKDFLMTPAPMEGTIRRRRVEDSAVNRVYSTRRSVRLAVKNSVEMVKEVENEESQLFKKDSVSKDGDTEETRDGVDNFNELSGNSYVDAITTVEEKSRNKDEAPEIVSICKDDFEPLSDQRQEDTSVVEIEFEAVSDQKQDISTGVGIKIDGYAEEKECTDFETEAKLEEEKCENEEEDMPMDVQQNNDGSQDVHLSETEITVERDTEEMKPEEGASQDEAADFVENVVVESGDNFIVGESSGDDTGFHDEIHEEPYNVTLDKLTEFILQQETTIQEDDSDFIQHSNCNEKAVQLNENEPNESVTLQLKKSEEADVDQMPSEEPYAEEPYADFSEQIMEPGPDVEMTSIIGFEESEKKYDTVLPSYEQNADFSEQIAEFVVEGLDSSAIIPSKKSDSSMAMKSGACLSDNKENIGSVVTKDVEVGTDKLQDMSMRKLRMMLKNLEITKKSSKDENKVEDEAMSRPALQAISENRSVDGTQN